MDDTLWLKHSGLVVAFRCRNCGANPPTEWGSDHRCLARQGESYLRAGCEYVAFTLDALHARTEITGVLVTLRAGVDDDELAEVIGALERARDDLDHPTTPDAVSRNEIER